MYVILNSSNRTLREIMLTCVWNLYKVIQSGDTELSGIPQRSWEIGFFKSKGFP